MEDERPAELQNIIEKAFVKAAEEVTDDAVIAKTFDGIILGWNKAAEKIYGYGAEEARGKSILLIVPPERVEEYWQIHERVARGERVDHFETVRMRKDGTRLPASLTISPIRDETGRIIAASAVGRDLSGNKRAQKMILAARKFSAAILEDAPIFFVAIDSHGNTLTMNRHMLETLGYRAEEVIGANYLSRFVPERDREALADIFSRLGTEHQPTINENYVVAKDGTEFFVAWRGKPIFDIEGRFLYFYGIGTDITDQRRKEQDLEKSREALEARVKERTAELMELNEKLKREIRQRIQIELRLRNSERRYHVLVEEVPDIIFVLDREGKFSYLNSRAEDFFGWSVEYLLGTSLKAHVIPEDHHKIDRIFTLGLDAIWDEEVGLTDANGKTGFAWIRCRTLRVDRRGPMEFEGVIRDISRRKMLEQELKSSRDELLEKIKIIDDLYAHIVELGKARAIADHTAEVAHELRQPLTIIGGFARRIMKEQESGNLRCQDRAYPAQIISSEIQRLEKILAGLIAYNRPEDIQLERTDPNAIIRQVLDVYDLVIRQKNLKLEALLVQDVGYALLDPQRFEQVVRNLVSNAIDAASSEGAIHIETSISTPSGKAHEIGKLESKRYFQMKIGNDGPVIKQQDLQRIFSPFFTTKNYGAGIGLTVAKKIVQAHKGSISVQSGESGTVFTVWLPLLEEPASAEKAQKSC